MNKKITFVLFALLTYTLSWQGTAQSGSTCDDPLVVDSMPFNDSGNTSTYGSNYSNPDVPPIAPGAVINGTGSPFYLSGDDVVYSYMAGANGSISINTTNDDDWVGLWVFTGCPFASTVGYHTSTGGATRSIPDLPVIAGETYYIVISTWAPPQSTNYTINITGTDIADPPTCQKPTGLTASNTTSSEVDVSWTPGGTETLWNFSWGPNGYTPGDADEIGAEVLTVTNYQITGLTAETGYDIYVQADCGSGDLSFWSGPLKVFTGYCIPTTTGDSGHISSVTIEGDAGQDISNLNSGPGLDGSGYSDFSAQSVMVTPEGTIEYTVTIESGQTAGLKIWIDWNNDLIFDGTTELVFQTTGYSGSFTGTIAMPVGVDGTHRMRIGSSYTPGTGPANSCGHTGQGEFEDYTIEIITLGACTEAVAGTIVGDTEREVCALAPFSLSVEGNSEPADGLIRTWQSSPAGEDDWTDLDVSNSTITIVGIDVPMDYRYHVECDNGDSDNSEVISVTLNPNPSECYCIPEGTNSARYINNFSTTGGIQNISNLESGFSPGGYGDFHETMTVSQAPSESVDFSADVVGGSAGFRIWVDWNQDGVFSPEEIAYTSSTYSVNPTGSFEVPAVALEGETRMRIASNWSSSTGDVDPCATGYGNGEFEDYTFEVIFPDECTGEPEAGTATVNPVSGNAGTTYTVSATGYTAATGLSFQWQSNLNGQGWEDEGTVTDFHTPYTATAPNNLGDEVEWRLALTCTASGETAYSETATFTVTLIYCDVTASTVEPITRVIFAGIDNSSSPTSSDGYEDFTAIVGEVEAGETYEFKAEGYTGGSYTNYFTVWVDWNHNGELEATEMYEIGAIYNSTGTDGQQAVSNIVVPEDALPGNTRMRVLKNFNTSRTNPCGSISYGQVEDYTVNVGDGGDDDLDCAQGDDSNGFENGKEIAGDGPIRHADDFIVSPNNTLNIRSVEINILSLEPINTLDLTFYNDDNGAPGNTIVESVSGLVPYSQVIIGSAFGAYTVYSVLVEVDLNFEGGASGANFWMEPVAYNGSTEVYWEISTIGTLGEPIHGSLPGGSMGSEYRWSSRCV